MQPYNYTFNAQSPGQSLLSGVKGGLDISNQIDRGNLFKAQQLAAEEVRQASIAKREQAQAMQQELVSLAQKKDKTSDDYIGVMTRHPSLAAGLEKSLGALTEQQRLEKEKQATHVYMMLDSGRNDLALKNIDEQIEASENSGDETQANGLKALKKSIEINPEAAKVSAGLMLAASMGKDKFADTMAKIQEVEQKKELNPIELKKQNIELKTKAVDLGLKAPQINKVLSQSKGFDKDTKEILLSLEADKNKKDMIVDPEKKNQAERELRKEYSAETADYTKTLDAFRKIDAAEDTAVGDLSLIFSFMKMLDPGSVVREGEFATAQNAAGVDEKIINMYNNIITGERLNPEQRRKFKSQAESLMKAAKQKDDDVKKVIMNPIKNYGLNPENVFGVEENNTAATEVEKPQPKLPEGAVMQNDGSILFPDGSVYRP